MDILVPTAEGLYCPAGDFHIDPWRPVARAVVTHGHADHARYGAGAYLTHEQTVPILRKRLGEHSYQGLAWGETLTLGDTRLSLHPAGHILGSSQVRIERGGEVWVVTGDYKLEADHTCQPFEPVACDVLLTESTFALPVYRWADPLSVYTGINEWWAAHAVDGRNCVLFAYALGKAQRVLHHVDASIGPIICHGAVASLNEVYRAAGVALPPTRMVSELGGEKPCGALVIAPPSAAGSAWMRRFGDYSDAFASGWMQIRGNRRRRGVDRGFVLSDHADWPGLLRAIAATGAREVIPMHGFTATLARYLQHSGIAARELGGEFHRDEVSEPDPE